MDVAKSQVVSGPRARTHEAARDREGGGRTASTSSSCTARYRPPENMAVLHSTVLLWSPVTSHPSGAGPGPADALCHGQNLGGVAYREREQSTR